MCKHSLLTHSRGWGRSPAQSWATRFIYTHSWECGRSPAQSQATRFHLSQVFRLLNDRQEIAAIMVNFFRYKHNYNQAPFSLVVFSKISCYLSQHLMAYLQGHDHIPCPIFQRHDGSPLPLSVFCEKHSLYIEAASNSTNKGMSDAQIRTMGVGSPIPF